MGLGVLPGEFHGGEDRCGGGGDGDGGCEPCGGGGDGDGGCEACGGGGDGGGGSDVEKPQSAQSVPMAHRAYSDPLPPSSQSESEAHRHVFTHGSEVRGGGGRGDCGGDALCGVCGGSGGEATKVRGPQSKQSVPRRQRKYSLPGPPSSQSLSLAHEHVLAQPLLLPPGGDKATGRGGNGDGGGGAIDGGL